METVENRKRFTHRSHRLRYPLFHLWLSPYAEKVFIFWFRGRTVTMMGRAQYVNTTQKNERHTGGFILKKSPET